MMDGHGNLIHRLPLTSLPVISCPCSSTSMGCTPGSGNVAYDGLAGVTPAMFEIMMPPVSVCHQVSTIGHLPLPILSDSQCHASSLIGSPTEPKTFRLPRSCPCTGPRP